MGSDEKVPKGYFIPLHKSLTEQILNFGVPRDFFYRNIIISLGIVTATNFYFFLVFSVVVHMVMAYYTKRDDQYFAALMRHIDTRRYYDA